MIEHLESLPNKQGYIISLIKKDMKEENLFIKACDKLAEYDESISKITNLPNATSKEWQERIKRTAEKEME